jgi:hypothetical protein
MNIPLVEVGVTRRSRMSYSQVLVACVLVHNRIYPAINAMVFRVDQFRNLKACGVPKSHDHVSDKLICIL